jgi:hypothetical protein
MLLLHMYFVPAHVGLVTSLPSWEGGVVVGLCWEQAKVVKLYNYISVVSSVQARAFN